MKHTSVRKNNALMRFLKLAFITLVVAGGAVLTVFINTPYRESSERVYIKSFAREGILFKAWEGVCIKISNAGADSVFAFSVYDHDGPVQQEIQRAALFNQPIYIEFKEKYFRFFWQPKSTRIAVSARVDTAAGM